jgi:hypothetical protein
MTGEPDTDLPDELGSNKTNSLGSNPDGEISSFAGRTRGVVRLVALTGRYLNHETAETIGRLHRTL